MTNSDTVWSGTFGEIDYEVDQYAEGFQVFRETLTRSGWTYEEVGEMQPRDVGRVYTDTDYEFIVTNAIQQESGAIR